MYASGKHSIAICDRCGTQVPHNTLRKLTINKALTNIMVCGSCWEPDHPQNYLDRVDKQEAIAIRDPRPNHNVAVERSMFGWSPIGNSAQFAQVHGGQFKMVLDPPPGGGVILTEADDEIMSEDPYSGPITVS